MYGWRCRIGVIVPSTNTAVESEFHRMAPRGVSVHAARMRATLVEEEALMRMNELAPEAALQLLDAEVDVLVYGCTGGSFIHTSNLHGSLGISRAADQTPLVLTFDAVLQALHALAATKIILATPYPEALTCLEERALEEAGFSVLSSCKLGISKPTDVGRLHHVDAYRLAKKASVSGAEAIFISCTDFPTIEIIDLLEQDTGLPVVTSNQAAFWLALRRCGIGDSLSGFGKLLREVTSEEGNF